MKLVKVGDRKVLDFDIENRPLSYWFGDVTTGEMTAIAWSWGDPKKVEVRALGEGECSMREMLTDFVAVYNQADTVTGHYIRKHDLPVINAMLMEEGMAILSDKKTHDTKLDLVRMRHLPASQEALGAMLGIEAPKVHMTQSMWRAANRLTPEGVKLTKERVVGDIVQHIEMRNELIARGWLRSPRTWYSVPGGSIYADE